MRRRDLIALMSGTAFAWPFVASAQQAGKLPTIGYLSAGSSGPLVEMTMGAFRRALAESGYIEGQSVTIESRYANGQYDRLPELAADLARRQVSVIVAAANPSAALAAKAATATIPILFMVADNPVKLGLVASLSRPDGNATGVNYFLTEMVAKRLGVMRELLPVATHFSVLVNPNGVSTDGIIQELTAAASALGVQIDVVLQITALAAHHAIPAIYTVREYVDVGGLISYGTSLTEAYRQLGLYAARILKGAKPADLPVVQSTKIELVINLQTARVLGIEVPPSLLAIADDVIE